MYYTKWGTLLALDMNLQEVMLYKGVILSEKENHPSVLSQLDNMIIDQSCNTHLSAKLKM